jgi:type IV secretory pathway ATPase VirB11/archaellum biosynthesis ATPase
MEQTLIYSSPQQPCIQQGFFFTEYTRLLFYFIYAKMDIVLFGMQGSGKGTQAQNIMAHYPNKYVYFEPG